MEKNLKRSTRYQGLHSSTQIGIVLISQLEVQATWHMMLTVCACCETTKLEQSTLSKIKQKTAMDELQGFLSKAGSRLSGMAANSDIQIPQTRTEIDSCH
jgi:hypothetical protein